MHAHHCITAAEAGKHVYLEKPVVKSLDELDAVEQAVNKAGIKVVVGFNRRFDSNAQTFHSRVAEVGQIQVSPTGVLVVSWPHFKSFSISSKDPSPPPKEYLETSGGIFADMTSHDLDMARFITGEGLRA